MRVFSTISFLFLYSFFCASVCGEEVEQETVRPMRIVMRHIDPGGIGYNQGYTTLEGFFSPIKPFANAWIPFLDLRGHLFNNGQPAANAGSGVRYLTSSRVWGANVYYDYRKTNREHYNQIAAGLESLGAVWDFRINGYLPVGKKRSSFWGSRFDHFQHHFAFLSRKSEFALKGANAEAAAHINAGKNVDVVVGMGPYYLVGRKDASWGGRARVEIDLFKYCKLSGFTSYDSIYQWTGQGELSIVIPFGAKREIKRRANQSYSTAASLATRTVQPVDRFEIIPVDRKKSRSKAIDPSTGKPYFFWFVNNTSHSLGTFESPFSTLIAAQNASAPGDVIYVFPGDGTSTGMDEGIVLKERQLLFGAGIIHRLSTTAGKLSIPPQASGLPNLIAPVGSSVVTLADNNSISGFQITSDANGTISGSYCIGSLSGTARDLFISQNILNANNGATGIIPNDPSGEIAIIGNTIQSDDGEGAYGIYLSQMDGSGFYMIQNNFISNFQNMTILLPDVPTGTGIAILAQNQSEVRAIVSENQILKCNANGIDIRAFGTETPTFSAMVSQNYIQGAPIQETGVYLISDGNAITTFQLLNNQVYECASGITARAEGFSFMTGSIQNNILSSAPLDSGIVLATNRSTQTDSATAVFQVIANDISFYGDDEGVLIGAYGTSSLTALIGNNRISQSGLRGVHAQGFNSSNTRLTIIGNSIFNNNSSGIEIDAFNDSTVSIVMQGNLITNNKGAGLFANSMMNSNAKYEIIANTFMGNNLLNLNTGSAVTMIPQDVANICLQMRNNQSTLEATLPDYDLTNMGSGQLNVEPLVGNTGTINQSGTTAVPVGFCDP